MENESFRNTSTPIHVCFSSDDNFVQHLAVTIASLLCNKNEDDRIHIHILDGGISPQNRERLNQLKHIADFDLDYIEMHNGLFQNCPVPDKGIWTLAVYYRFIIPNLLPELDKCIYLDADIIIQGSLSELYSMDVDGYYMAGVLDILQKSLCKRTKLESYYNSGVLLINLKKWREDNVIPKLFDYTEKHPDELACVDQDVLNAVLKSAILRLDSSWNLQLHATHDLLPPNMKQLARNAKIIHYVGADKPWKHKIFRPYRSLYFKHLKLTSWKSFYWRWLLKATALWPFVFLKNLRRFIFQFRIGKKRYLRLFGITIYSNVKKDISVDNDLV